MQKKKLLHFFSDSIITRNIISQRQTTKTKPFLMIINQHIPYEMIKFKYTIIYLFNNPIN